MNRALDCRNQVKPGRNYNYGIKAKVDGKKRGQYGADHRGAAIDTPGPWHPLGGLFGQACQAHGEWHADKECQWGNNGNADDDSQAVRQMYQLRE